MNKKNKKIKALFKLDNRKERVTHIKMNNKIMKLNNLTILCWNKNHMILNMMNF